MRNGALAPPFARALVARFLLIGILVAWVARVLLLGLLVARVREALRPLVSWAPTLTLLAKKLIDEFGTSGVGNMRMLLRAY